MGEKDYILEEIHAILVALKHETKEIDVFMSSISVMGIEDLLSVYDDLASYTSAYVTTNNTIEQNVH